MRGVSLGYDDDVSMGSFLSYSGGNAGRLCWTRWAPSCSSNLHQVRVGASRSTSTRCIWPTQARALAGRHRLHRLRQGLSGQRPHPARCCPAAGSRGAGPDHRRTFGSGRPIAGARRSPRPPDCRLWSFAPYATCCRAGKARPVVSRPAVQIVHGHASGESGTFPLSFVVEAVARSMGSNGKGGRQDGHRFFPPGAPTASGASRSYAGDRRLEGRRPSASSVSGGISFDELARTPWVRGRHGRAGGPTCWRCPPGIDRPLHAGHFARFAGETVTVNDRPHRRPQLVYRRASPASRTAASSWPQTAPTPSAFRTTTSKRPALRGTIDFSA